MNSKGRFVPVSQLPGLAEFDPEIHNVSWDFTLPPSVDIERVCIDMKALNRTQKISALSSNHIREYVGDRSEYDIAIAGINSDGTAIAGKAKLSKKAETDQSVLLDDITGEFGSSVMQNYFKARAIHKLNKTEIASRVLDGIRDRGMLREKAWTFELNNALVKSVNDSARNNLMKRSSKSHKLLSAAGLTPGVLFITQDILLGRPEAAALVGVALGIAGVFVVSMDSLANKMAYGESLLSERRWSVLPVSGWQPDRYVATLALNSINPLIRYRK